MWDVALVADRLTRAKLTAGSTADEGGFYFILCEHRTRKAKPATQPASGKQVERSMCCNSTAIFVRLNATDGDNFSPPYTKCNQNAYVNSDVLRPEALIGHWSLAPFTPC
jgi:hypothetical protein